MIFLIAKIFVYLLLALGLGAAAGWLWRHQQATGREAELEKALLDARSRLPQMETALRAREERVEVLGRELAARDEAVAAHEETVAARDRAVTELERACADLRQRLAEIEAAGTPETPDHTAAEDELALHPGDPHAGDTVVAADPAPASDAHGAPVTLPEQPGLAADGADQSADAGTPPTVTEAEIEALEAELEETRAALASAQNALAGEQRRVTELTRERELQHHALKALEQQLELAQERRAANG
ncbi:MAG: hypothetical protein CMD39_11335 [Gammaproteobacteria bacterium]|nr:hypothetical protein [Gammaproteobacteria bacterium]